MPLTFQEYKALHFAFMKVLTIQLTLKCPLRCGHCNVDAHAKRSEDLSSEKVVAIIEDFAKKESSRLVFFTGGEPFLNLRRLEKALTVCKQTGLLTYVITSGSWATSLERAKRILKSLPEMDLISISTDKWHSQYLNKRNLLNAVAAVAEAGISLNLALVLENEEDPYLIEIKNLLADYWDRIDVEIDYVRKVGRSEVGNQQFSKHLPEGYCARIGTPVVLANGSVAACCCPNETNAIENTVKFPDHELRIGNVKEITIKNIEETYKEDLVLKAIRLFGPAWLFKIALKHELLEISNEGYRDICDVCSKIVRNKEVSGKLKEILGKSKYRVQLNYLEK